MPQTEEHFNSDPNHDNNLNLEITPFVWEIWAVSDYIPYVEETFLSQLQKGDEVWIKKDTAGYAHVALYIGRGKIVHISEVDKTGLFPGKSRVSKDPLTKIATGRFVGYKKTNATTEEQMEIVNRALGDIDKIFSYALTSQNCEHQVRYWISGKQEFSMVKSTQIRDFLAIAAITGFIGLAIGGVVSGFFIRNPLIIVAVIIGCGVGCAILGVVLKYLLTTFEHRTFCY